jgi:2-phospho-L-lactate/phosphoenolpyruvate guanylyltransferase
LIEVYAIVPVREFKDAKQRLGNFLDEPGRAALAKALLLHVLRSLEQAERITGVLVVSSGGKQSAENLASFPKVEVIQESKFHGGVNSAVNDGIDFVRQSGEDREILVIPSDLPLLSYEAVDLAVQLLEEYDVVINPSLRKDGTNLLAFHLSKIIPLWYDRNSFPNHVREVESRKFHYLITNWKEFSYDVDDQKDLEGIMNQFKVKTLDSFLRLLN